MRRNHDMGGLDAGPINQIEREHLPWERRVDAIVRILSSKKYKILRVDELRRGIEDLETIAYKEFNYYERWISSVTNILIEKGFINISELDQQIKLIKDKQDFIN